MTPEQAAWTGFFLGLVGAGAWIPHIREWLRKPDVRIVPAENFELSYLDVGAVLNISCAFAALKKSALIESIDLTIEHSQGQRLEFRCVGLNESASARSSSGESSQWDKTSTVHTIALGADTSLERKLWFREKAGMARRIDVTQRALLLIDRLTQSHGDGWRTAMRSSSEYAECRELVAEGQLWRSGRYKATITVRVAQLSESLARDFEFTLSDADIRHIRTNVPIAENYIEGLMLKENVVRPNDWAFAFPWRH